MLMRFYLEIHAKTPYTVVAYDPVDISSFVQPFEHAIKRYPVEPVLTLEPALKFMVADGPLLLKERGKNLDSAGGRPLRPAQNHLLRLFP